MPDELAEFRRRIEQVIERRMHVLANQMGIPLPGGGPALTMNPLAGAGDMTADADTFATGYDSGTGETTMAFTLDVSILYGDGTSGDILTGS